MTYEDIVAEFDKFIALRDETQRRWVAYTSCMGSVLEVNMLYKLYLEAKVTSDMAAKIYTENKAQFEYQMMWK
jgi:hypothetical protein